MSGSIEMDKCNFCQEIKQVERTYLQPSKYVKEQGAFINKTLYNEGDYFIIVKTCADCGTPTPSQTLKENHIVDTNEMVKRGTLKKRMDKDAWFVVFQSNAYNESDMAYELIKSQEIDIDMYDVYKDGDEVTFEVVNKKWAKITPFLYPFKTTSSQTEISDEEIEKEGWKYCYENKISLKNIVPWINACEWYREQLKKINDKTNR